MMEPIDYRQKREIKERGIHKIMIEAVNAARDRQFIPINGEAKWFVDELGQVWVKFTTKSSSKVNPGNIQHVIPASRVTEVQYLKAGR